MGNNAQREVVPEEAMGSESIPNPGVLEDDMDPDTETLDSQSILGATGAEDQLLVKLGEDGNE